MSARVLVTGGGGMLGSAVVRRLLADGVDVRVHLGPPGAVVQAPPPGVETGWAEITDPEAVGPLCRGVDAVLHLAGPPSVAASFTDPVGFVRAHVEGTAVVLEACRRQGVGRLVHVSSAEVYGAVGGGVAVETALPRPASPYAAAKVGTEALVLAAARRGLAAVVLRPFSVYGAHSPATSLVGTLLRASLADPVVELRSLTPVRDYVHVADLASAVVAGLARTLRNADHAVLNVGTGIGTSVLELARLTLAARGRSGIEVRQLVDPDRPPGTDLSHLVADVTAAREELGWLAQVDLADGLAEAISPR